MIIFLEKKFGEIKRLNKLKKKLWEEKLGEDYVKKSYEEYLDFGKKVDLDSVRKEIVSDLKPDIISNRQYKNMYNPENLKFLPELKDKDVLRSHRRFEKINDKLKNKVKEKNLFGSLDNYYSNRLSRFKFEKDKKNLKTEIDLLEKYRKKDPVTSLNLQKKSIPIMTKFKRFFKKNINRILK